MATISDGSAFDGICIHAIQGYFHLYSTFSTSNNNFNFNLDSLIKMDEDFMCLTKDPNNSFHQKPAGSINSEAENRNYDVVDIFTNYDTNLYFPKFTVRCIGRFYLEKICDTCCSKPNKISRSLWASEYRSGGGTLASQPTFDYTTKINDLRNFIRRRDLSNDYNGISIAHPYWKNKIFDIFDLLVDLRFKDEEKNKKAKDIAKDIDSYLKASYVLNCANSAQACLPCTSMSQMDLNIGDPIYKPSNVVIFEESSHPKSSFSYSTNFINPYDELKLKYEQDKAWINMK